MFCLCELDLNAVDTVNAVNEQDEDEDEGDLRSVRYVLPSHALSVSSYLQAVLQLRDERVLAYEGKQRSLDFERHGDDQGHEDDHLEDEKSEDLQCRALSASDCELR
jgi:hypothetical protein